MIALTVAALLVMTPYERAPLGADDIDWVALPQAEDFERFYPETTARPVETLIVLECVVGRGGRLGNCRLVNAPVSDNGLIEATLRLSSKFRMGQRSKSGEATVGRKVRVPVRWKAPE